MNKIKGNLILNIFEEKCPHCRKGKIFLPAPYPIVYLPKMNKKCSECGYTFEREPGYFIGAMYVSYGLAVLEGLITFLTAHFLFGISSIPLLLCIIIPVFLLFSMWNFKLSRVIFMYIFAE